MIQFTKQRKNARPLQEILFYGEIDSFIEISNAISSFNVPSNMLSMPASINSTVQFDFTKYANAIGALYHRNKELEHINLLRSTAAKEKQGMAPFFIALGATVLGSIAAVFIANFVITMINDNIKAQTSSVKAQISDPELQSRLTALEEREQVLNNFKSYRTTIQNADNIFEFMPKATTDVVKMLREPIEKQEGVEDITPADIREKLKSIIMVDSVQISGYNVTASFIAEDEAHLRRRDISQISI